MAKLNNDLVQITGLSAGSWGTKDLSGAPWNVPSSATGLLLVIRNTNASNQYDFGFGPGSRLGGIAAYTQLTAFPGISSSTLAYYIGSTDITVWLAGYFENDAAFFGSAIQQTNFYDYVWTTTSIASNVPQDAVAAIFEVVDKGKTGKTVGFYTGGGTIQNFVNDIYYHSWFICPLSASREYAVFASQSDHEIYLTGYLTAGSWSSYPWADKTLGSSDSFVDVDLTAQSPPWKVVGAIVLVRWYQNNPQADKRFALRYNGSTDDWADSHCLRNQCHYPVKIDTGDIFEGKIDDSGLKQEFYLVGFLTDALTGVTQATTSMVGTLAQLTMAPAEATSSVSFELPGENIGDVVFPVMEVEADGDWFLGEANLVIPTMEIEADGLLGIVGDGDCRFPTMVVEAEGNTFGEIQFPLMVVEGSGHTGIAGTGEIELPALQVLGDGHTQGVAEGSVIFPPMRIEATGSVGIIGSADINFRITVHATGFSGIVGEGDVRFKPMRVYGTILAGIYGDGNITFPILHVLGYGDTSALSQVQKAFVMNATNFAVTEYDFYIQSFFNSIGYFNGEYIGSSEDGLYFIGGERKKDGDKLIDGEIECVPIDMWKDRKNYPVIAWVTLRTDGKMVLTVRRGEHDQWEKELSWTGIKMHEERAKIAKGIKDRFLSFGLKNRSGADFDIDKITLETDQSETKR